jgi:hypothetical protein
MKAESKIALTLFAGALLALLHNEAPAQTVAVATGTSGKVHLLPATMETTQLGWYDNAQKPVLTVKPGDTVIMETRMHFHDRLVPGATLDMLAKIRQEVPGRGAHTLTGPIYVEGAEPGDVLKVKINKIVPRSYGVNMNYPGLAGQFPKEFPEGESATSISTGTTKLLSSCPVFSFLCARFPVSLVSHAPNRAATAPSPQDVTAAIWIYAS